MRHSDPSVARAPPVHGISHRTAKAYAQALRWLRRPNVNGVLVGPKYRKGKKVGARPCIVIMVTKKLDEKLLRKSSVFPKRIDGVRVDVIEGGCSPQSLLRPGREIYQEGAIESGTLGMFVRSEENEPCILTAAHIFKGDGRAVFIGADKKLVARLKLTVFDERGDGALATLDLPAGMRADPRILGLNYEPAGVGRATLNSIVEKRGSVSRVTTAKVEAAGQLTIDGGAYRLTCRALYLVPALGGSKKVSDPGDSGAVWIDQQSQIAVGLHVAGDPVGSPREYGWACDLVDVLKALGATYPA